jgi:antitoxin component of RelBE/YafQ-DinJ toxin-antitoxin module
MVSTMKDKNMTKAILIRVDANLYDSVKAKADALGLSLSAYVRILIINDEQKRTS